MKAPSAFPNRQVGKTMVTKTQGTKLAKDGLMGRVFEASLGDLKTNAEDDAFRKFKLRVEEVQGSNCLTNFYGCVEKQGSSSRSSGKSQRSRIRESERGDGAAR